MIAVNSPGKSHKEFRIMHRDVQKVFTVFPAKQEWATYQDITLYYKEKTEESRREVNREIRRQMRRAQEADEESTRMG